MLFVLNSSGLVCLVPNLVNASVYQHWRESRLYCLLWERRVCLPHSIHLGDFQQDSLIIWGFLLNSIMLWANPLSQIDLRGRPRTEMSRRMKCPRFILEVRETPVFLSSYLVPRPEVALGGRDDSFSPRSTPSPVYALGLDGLSSFELPFKM